MDDPIDNDDENALVKLTSLLVLGLGLAALFLDVDHFWLVFAIGFAVVVPIVKVVTDEFGVGSSVGTTVERDRTTPDRTADSDSTGDALDTLRERYARGDLSEAEFERKVEALLETETPEGARRRVERTTREREDGGGDESGTEERRTTRRETPEADPKSDERAR